MIVSLERSVAVNMSVAMHVLTQESVQCSAVVFCLLECSAVLLRTLPLGSFLSRQSRCVRGAPRIDRLGGSSARVTYICVLGAAES